MEDRGDADDPPPMYSILQVQIPCLSVNFQVQFKLREHHTEQALEAVEELVSAFATDVAAEAGGLDRHGTEERLAVMREQARRGLEDWSEKIKLVDTWKSKVDRANSQLNKMREAYLKEVTFLKEQLYEKSKAQQKGTEFRPDDEVLFIANKYTIEEQGTAVLNDKINLLQSQCQMMEEERGKLRGRIQTLNDQLMTTKMMLSRKEKLIEKLAAPIAVEGPEADQGAGPQPPAQLLEPCRGCGRIKVDAAALQADLEHFRAFLERKFGSLAEAGQQLGTTYSHKGGLAFEEFAKMIDAVDYTCNVDRLFASLQPDHIAFEDILQLASNREVPGCRGQHADGAAPEAPRPRQKSGTLNKRLRRPSIAVKGTTTGELPAHLQPGSKGTAVSSGTPPAGACGGYTAERSVGTSPYDTCFGRVQCCSTSSQTDVDTRMLDKAMEYYEARAEDDWQGLMRGRTSTSPSESEEEEEASREEVQQQRRRGVVGERTPQKERQRSGAIGRGDKSVGAGPSRSVGAQGRGGPSRSRPGSDAPEFHGDHAFAMLAGAEPRGKVFVELGTPMGPAPSTALPDGVASYRFHFGADAAAAAPPAHSAHMAVDQAGGVAEAAASQPAPACDRPSFGDTQGVSSADGARGALARRATACRAVQCSMQRIPLLAGFERWLHCDEDAHEVQLQQLEEMASEVQHRLPTMKVKAERLLAEVHIRECGNGNRERLLVEQLSGLAVKSKDALPVHVAPSAKATASAGAALLSPARPSHFRAQSGPLYELLQRHGVNVQEEEEALALAETPAVAKSIKMKTTGRRSSHSVSGASGFVPPFATPATTPSAPWALRRAQAAVGVSLVLRQQDQAGPGEAPQRLTLEGSRLATNLEEECDSGIQTCRKPQKAQVEPPTPVSARRCDRVPIVPIVPATPRRMRTKEEGPESPSRMRSSAVDSLASTQDGGPFSLCSRAEDSFRSDSGEASPAAGGSSLSLFEGQARTSGSLPLAQQARSKADHAIFSSSPGHPVVAAGAGSATPRQHSASPKGVMPSVAGTPLPSPTNLVLDRPLGTLQAVLAAPTGMATPRRRHSTSLIAGIAAGRGASVVAAGQQAVPGALAKALPALM